MASSSTPPNIHVHPHTTHISRDPPIVGDAGEIEDHDYESLPVGAGWGVNMMAGAMVRVYGNLRFSTDDLGWYIRARSNFPCRLYQSESSNRMRPRLGRTNKTDTDASPTLSHANIAPQPLFLRRLRIRIGSRSSSTTSPDDLFSTPSIGLDRRGN